MIEWGEKFKLRQVLIVIIFSFLFIAVIDLRVRKQLISNVIVKSLRKD